MHRLVNKKKNIKFLYLKKNGLNKTNERITCEYNPCHFHGQDCTFCYCPFYPCLDFRTGGSYIKKKSGKRIWDCSLCKVVHIPKISFKILNYLIKYENNIKKSWIKVVIPFIRNIKSKRYIYKDKK